jgi:apolipoprotein N-acyltransferase
VDRHRLSLAFLSGLMLAFAFPKLDLPWLAWFAPGLTLALGAGQSGKRVFYIGCCAGLGRYLASLYWFLCIPMPVYAVAAWLAISLYLALFVGGWCWFCWRVFPKAPVSGPVSKAGRGEPNEGHADNWRGLAGWPALCAAGWVAMEMGFAHVLTGFPWNLLGASQYKVLPLIQIASITGVYGVSFVVVWISVSVLAAAVVSGSAHPIRTWAQALVLPLLGVLGLVGFGLQQLAAPEPSGLQLKAALVQPSIPQQTIWNPNEASNRLSQLIALSKEALAERPNLLVWPEAALPGTLARTRATQELVTGLVSAYNVWMVLGAEDSGRRTRPDGSEEIARLNSAFFVNPAGDLVARYHKRHLVAFGEYMPGAGWLPFLKRFREQGGGFARGKGPVTFQIGQPHARISTLICFEDMFPHVARESVDEDTDVLLNLTNNGWFGESAAQWQHAVGGLFRAVENGVPLVRCTNNGLTCWIDARGRLHEVYFPGSRNIYQAGFKIARIPMQGTNQPRARTFYNRYGDWFGWACVTVTGAALLGSFRLFKRARLK